MINLLPPEEKRQLRAARSNNLLIRYNILLLGVVAFMGLSIGITYVYLSTAQAGAKQTIEENNAKVSEYAKVKADAEKFRQNLSIAKQVLDNEVTYSKVILEIAQLIPRGVILENLSLDSQNFGTETTLTAKAKSYNDTLKLKDSFGKSELFSDVHFASITQATTNDAYPITVNLNVTIKKEALK